LDINCSLCKERTKFFTVMYINVLEHHCWHVYALCEFW
jgi:hypothetical protein